MSSRKTREEIEALEKTRAGTMTAEEVDRELERLTSMMAGDRASARFKISEHIAAHGAQFAALKKALHESHAGTVGTNQARIAGMEQHISDLEKSLEDARKERDDALAGQRIAEERLASAHAQCNGLGCGRCEWCVEQARQERDTWRQCADEQQQAAQEQMADKHAIAKERDDMRSEAVGAVKAMIEILSIIGASPDEPAADAARRVAADRDDALSDLTRLAGEVETGTFTPDLYRTNGGRGAAEAVSRMHVAATSERMRLTGERDAALASSAALLRVVRLNAGGGLNGTCLECGMGNGNHFPECVTGDSASRPHPGAALLEEHRKEIDAWRKATTCDSPEQVDARARGLRQHVADANERIIKAAEEHRKALVRARNEGRTQGIHEAMKVCKEEGRVELMPCIADLLEEPEQ